MARVPAVDATLFATVVIGVVVIGVVIALVCALAGRDAWATIGRGGLWSPGGRSDPSDDQRDEEIRQMLEARRDRLARRDQSAAGSPDRPDVPGPDRAEPASGARQEVDRRKLPDGPAAADGELAEEIRQLALARNARRRRQGLEPLDVEAEVSRRLREL